MEIRAGYAPPYAKRRKKVAVGRYWAMMRGVA
jgi:hypothetical protein